MQDLKDDRDIRDVEVTYLLNSGKAFQITKAHPEPQEVRVEDILKPRRSLSSVKGQHCHILPRSVIYRECY